MSSHRQPRDELQGAKLSWTGIDPDQGQTLEHAAKWPMQQRFKLRHAVIGYVVALVFGFDGLLTSVTDATIASGGASFALITCLGSQGPGQQWPGQSDHASKCSCNLNCCCASGTLAHGGNEIAFQYPAPDTANLQHPHTPITRDVSAAHPLHLRSPPTASS